MPPAVTTPSPLPNSEVSLSEMGWALRRRGNWILRVTGAAFALAIVTAFLIPVKYSAEAVILTPQAAQPSLSAMAQLAGVGGGAGLSGLSLLSGFGLRNTADLYVGILQSRTIADSIISRFRLKETYHSRDLYAARKRLARNTTIKAGRDTLIHINVDDHDPRLSAELANAYVDELSRQNTTVALTEASQRRLFFEQQLAKEKDALANAEVAMRDTQQNTGLVAPTGQAEAMIRSASQLHAEILSKQAQIAGMSSYVADENPKFQGVQRELGALQKELNNLELGSHIAGTPEVPVGELPQAGLQYVRKYRDVKYHEGLYEILAKQYEAARLDEAKSAPLVQVIDRAVVPERKSWPPRTLLVTMVTLGAAALASFWVLLTMQSSRAAS